MAKGLEPLWLNDSELSFGGRVLYRALLEQMGLDNPVQLIKEHIAASMGYRNKDSIEKYVKELVGAGLLELVFTPSRFVPNDYILRGPKSA